MGVKREKETKNRIVCNPLEDGACKPKETKTKAKAEEKTSVSYPLKTKINPYGFLHFRKKWLEDLDWHKGMSVEINKNPDGSVTIRR